MKIKILLFIVLTGFLTVTLVYTPLCIAEQSLEISAYRELTSDQIEKLRSFGLNLSQLNSLKKLVSRSEEKVEISFDKTQKIPDFLKAELLLTVETVQPKEKGYYFFEIFKDLYKMKAPRKELSIVRATEKRIKKYNIRYQQLYRGKLVVGAETIVHIKPEGKLWFIEGKYIPDINISIEPVIQKAKVSQIVHKHFIDTRGTEVRFDMSDLDVGVLNTWIYDRSFESRNILIWIALVKEVPSGREWTYYVNAQNGKILDVIDSARIINSEIWDNQKTEATGDDEKWYIDDVLQTLSPKATLDTETTDLNNFVTEYWNYLHNTFKVYSINSATKSADGMKLKGHAYYNGSAMGCPNACYDCIDDEAIFCENRVTREVVAHEFTHGLVEHSGGDLTYRNQSGALNESFADVFSEFVDCRAGNCTWLRHSRDLSNPLNLGNRNQDPDHVGNTGDKLKDHPLYMRPCDPTLPKTNANSCKNRNNDRGGVHSNSGVPNIVAYLIVNGTQPNDPHYNYHIRGIGISKTEHLYYDTLVNKGLSSSADFLQAKNVMLTICKDFASKKKHGFTDNDCCQVQNAWASVGVGTGCSILKGNNISGVCSEDNAPYLVTDNAIIPKGSTLTVDPNVDVYFFPNVKVKVLGHLDAKGGSKVVRLLRSMDSKGMDLSGDFELKNGGELMFITNTYISNDTKPRPITLYDNLNFHEISSFIRIDKGFTVNDLNVKLNIKHTRDSDLRVTLESPSGTSVLLFNGVGGLGADFINTVLDDEADTLINMDSAPFTGSFRPQNNLSAFDGENSAGYWRLRIDDTNTGGNTGSLESWSISFGP